MLVLSRKAGEKIVIDGNITVTVLSQAGGRVRLGINAPQEVAIARDEIAFFHAAAGRYEPATAR